MAPAIPSRARDLTSEKIELQPGWQLRCRTVDYMAVALSPALAIAQISCRKLRKLASVTNVIIVTGSRIPQANLESPAPVTVVSGAGHQGAGHGPASIR